MAQPCLFRLLFMIALVESSSAAHFDSRRPTRAEIGDDGKVEVSGVGGHQAQDGGRAKIKFARRQGSASQVKAHREPEKASAEGNASAGGVKSEEAWKCPEFFKEDDAPKLGAVAGAKAVFISYCVQRRRGKTECSTIAADAFKSMGAEEAEFLPDDEFCTVLVDLMKADHDLGEEESKKALLQSGLSEKAFQRRQQRSNDTQLLDDSFIIKFTSRRRRGSSPTPSPSPRPRPTPSPSPTPSPPPSPPASCPSSDQKVSTLEWTHFQLLNQLRAAGFSCPDGTHFPANSVPLKFDCRLYKASQLHSQDMANKNYFAHNSQDGRTPWDRAKAQGYMKPSGENIAAGSGTAQGVLDQWKGSNGHCLNMGKKGNMVFAVGHATGGGYGHYWTQMFGWDSDTCTGCTPAGASPMSVDAKELAAEKEEGNGATIVGETWSP